MHGLSLQKVDQWVSSLRISPGRTHHRLAVSRKCRTPNLSFYVTVGHANRLAVEVSCKSGKLGKSKEEPSRVSEWDVVLQLRDQGLSPRRSHQPLHCVSSPFSISIAVCTLHNYFARARALLLTVIGHPSHQAGDRCDNRCCDER